LGSWVSFKGGKNFGKGVKFGEKPGFHLLKGNGGKFETFVNFFYAQKKRV